MKRRLDATGPALGVALLAHRMVSSAVYLLLGSSLIVAIGLAALPAVLAAAALSVEHRIVPARRLALVVALALLVLLAPLPLIVAGSIAIVLDVVLLLYVLVRLRPYGLAGAVPVLMAFIAVSSLVPFTDGIPPSLVVDDRLLPPELRERAMTLARPMASEELDDVAALFEHLTGEEVTRTRDGFTLHDFAFHVLSPADYTAVLSSVKGIPPSNAIIHALEQPAFFFGMDAYLGGSKEQVLRRAMHEYAHIVDTRTFGRTSHAAITEGFARSLERVAVFALYEQEKARLPSAEVKKEEVRQAAFERVRDAMLATPAQEVVLNGRPQADITRHRVQVITYYISPKNLYNRALSWDDLPEGGPERVQALAEVYRAVFPFSPRSAELPSSHQSEMALLEEAAESMGERPSGVARGIFIEEHLGRSRERIRPPISAYILPLLRMPRGTFRAAVVLWCVVGAALVLAVVAVLDRAARVGEEVLVHGLSSSMAREIAMHGRACPEALPMICSAVPGDDAKKCSYGAKVYAHMRGN